MGKNSAIAENGNTAATVSEFREIRKSEPEWLYRIRKKAWGYFISSSLPERSDHLWRYTDPEIFFPDEPGRFQNNGEKSDYRDIKDRLGISAENENDLRSKGVIFDSLSSVIEHGKHEIEKYLGKAVVPEFGKFESLNMAIWNSGLFLRIPENTVIEKPIHISYFPGLDFQARRLLIVMGDNSEATIIDDYRANERYLGLTTNGVSEIFAGKNSKLKYLCFNRLENNHLLYLTGRAVIGADTSIESVYAGFGGRLSKINAGVTLAGKGSYSKMTGFIYSNSDRRTDYHTRHHHTAGDSYSDLDFKVVLKDKAASAYTGLIRIEKDARNCEAYQENRNLLLTEGARAESIPELEILTDQVKCSHGATMGPVDPEMVFYLKSRGIPESRAIRLIIDGFFESTLAKSPDPFKEILTGELNSRLDKNEID